MSTMSSRTNVLQGDRPVAEVLVDGELSPFEHEALYRIIRRHFRVEQPSYSELQDETISTRVNIVFHHSYDRAFFTEIVREDWRDLKELFRQISDRRAGPGAGFTLTFVDEKIRLFFVLGILGGDAVGSAMDQLAHLTGIIGQMISPDKMVEPLGLVEVGYNSWSDMWQVSRGVGLNDRKEYVFDQGPFRWRTP